MANSTPQYPILTCDTTEESCLTATGLYHPQTTANVAGFVKGSFGVSPLLGYYIYKVLFTLEGKLLRTRRMHAPVEEYYAVRLTANVEEETTTLQLWYPCVQLFRKTIWCVESKTRGFLPLSILLETNPRYPMRWSVKYVICMVVVLAIRHASA